MSLYCYQNKNQLILNHPGIDLSTDVNGLPHFFFLALVLKFGSGVGGAARLDFALGVR